MVILDTPLGLCVCKFDSERVSASPATNLTARHCLRTRSFFLLCLNHQFFHGPLSLFCQVSESESEWDLLASPFSLLQQPCFQLLMVVCTGDARQLRVNSLNLALPSGMRTCSQFTEYEYLHPPPTPQSVVRHSSALT